MVEDVTNVPNYLRTSWTESSRYYTDDIMDEIWRREASKIASHRIALFSRPFAHSPIETISWHLSKDPTSILLTCLLVFPRILFAFCFLFLPDAFFSFCDYERQIMMFFCWILNTLALHIEAAIVFSFLLLFFLAVCASSRRYNDLQRTDAARCKLGSS